jgi:hypothetical protein
MKTSFAVFLMIVGVSICVYVSAKLLGSVLNWAARSTDGTGGSRESRGVSFTPARSTELTLGADAAIPVKPNAASDITGLIDFQVNGAPMLVVRSEEYAVVVATKCPVQMRTDTNGFHYYTFQKPTIPLGQHGSHGGSGQ